MERKSFDLNNFTTGNGVFAGYASVFDNVDAGGDVVVRGAFAKTLPDFLRDGFISDAHDWTKPVAIPVAAREDAHGLYITGRFHSTPGAQALRTIATERVGAGKRVGLSIGYQVEDFVRSGKGRILKVLQLLEVGIVMVPMNREANLTAVKGLDLTCDEADCILAEAKALEADLAGDRRRREIAIQVELARFNGVPV